MDKATDTFLTVNPKFESSRVRFSFFCLDIKDKETKKVKFGDSKKFFNKLSHIEKLTWKQWIKEGANSGLNFEKEETDMFKEIQKATEDKIFERLITMPFHFRIDQGYRVFGIQYDDRFMITHIDPNHKKQKSFT